MGDAGVQWGNGEAIRRRALRAFGLLAVGILVLLAIPIALALDVGTSAQDGSASAGVVAIMTAVTVLGLVAGVVGFRSGLAIRRTRWLELTPRGIELWRGSSRRPKDVLPWSGLVAAETTAEPALLLRYESRADSTGGSGSGQPDRDHRIALDPASGDPRSLAQEITARIQPPR